MICSTENLCAGELGHHVRVQQPRYGGYIDTLIFTWRLPPLRHRARRKARNRYRRWGH